jgi:photosystem II stability/assembly factor-like uncharacterized protein
MDNNPWTVNFGNSWGIESICHSDANTVWIAGGSRAYKSVDKGKNWELAVTVNSSFTINKILFTTPQIGYFFAYNYPPPRTIVGKTTDSGINWNLSQIDSLEVIDVFFLNADTGWVIGYPYNDCLRKTVDGGTTWENMHFDAGQLSTPEWGQGVVSVFFLNSQIGWIGGDDNFVAGTRDGGNTWTVLRNNSIASRIEKIHFINENVGWALCSRGSYGGMLMYTTDGGKSWNDTLLRVLPGHGSSVIVNDIHFSSYNGWIAGSHNSVFRTQNYGGLEGAISVKPSLRLKQSVTPLNIKLSSVKTNKGVVKINYTLNKESLLSITVYNLRGSKIAYAPQYLHKVGDHKFLFKAPKGFYIVEAVLHGKSGEATRLSEKVFVR